MFRGGCSFCGDDNTDGWLFENLNLIQLIQNLKKKCIPDKSIKPLLTGIKKLTHLSPDINQENSNYIDHSQFIFYKKLSIRKMNKLNFFCDIFNLCLQKS